jgi:tRNA-2-methylthio-N6-dimethylallyladenosine synthase
MQREYTRDWYLERIAWTKAAKRDISLTSDIIVGFPGETDRDFEDTITLLDEVGYDAIYGFKYSRRPNTPAIHMADSIPEEVKVQRLAILNARQREIQRANYARHLGQTMPVMVEHGANNRGQITGRSSQNKTVNFVLKGTGFSPSVGSQQGTGASAPEGMPPPIGSYIDVRITQIFPSSLVGEAISAPTTPSPTLLAQQALNTRIEVLT